MIKVKFNDDYSHNGVFKAGEIKELTKEQYDCAKGLKCSYDPNKPLIEDVPAGTVKSNEPEKK